VEDGTYDYKVRAVDNAGNRGEWSDTYTVVVDTQDPEILFVNPIDGGVTSPDTTLLILTNEDAYCEYMVGEADGEDMDGETTTHSADLVGLVEGELTITVYCEDMAGNEAEESITFTVTDERPQTSSTVVNPDYTMEDPRITAQIESQNSPIEEAKFCIRRPDLGAPDLDAEENCYEFDAQDGVFDEYKEAVESVIDISEMDEGVWVAYTNARDTIGWGEYDAEDFVVDRVAPIIDEEGSLVVEGSAECHEEYVLGCSGTPDLSCYDLGLYGGEYKCEETSGCDWEEEYDEICIGEPESCEVYDAEQCVLFAGCELIPYGECVGESPNCQGYYDPETCGEDLDCEWMESDPFCFGIPTETCEQIQSIGEANEYEDKCNETPGCYWDDMLVNEYCDGTPAKESCTAYDEEQCINICGCEWGEEYGWICSGSSEFELEVETNEPTYCEYSDSEFELGEGMPFLQGQWTDQHISTVVVPEDGYYMYFVICEDYVGLQSTAVIHVEVDSVMDHEAPIVIGSDPEGTVDTNEVTLIVETDGYAHCEYSTAQFEYGDGTMFESTGTTTHTQALTLSDGSYAYFV
ncbi:MAG: hypothetical protein KAJ47_03905, partial [Candidatus Aenigmarchaeota archaeon]|nr:hypothetical protein [Candidatus Aenigmarchaeota archaeon]